MAMFSNIFSRGGFTFDRLRRFCEVADAGSISAAVQKHNRNQSSYSRDIKALEEFFDAPLFIQRGTSRSGKRLDGLTPRGEALRILALEFFESLNALVEFNEPPSALRIGAGETILQWVISTRLNEIRALDPEIQIHFDKLRSDQILQRIAKGTIDIGVLESEAIAGVDEEEVSALKLGEISYALYLNEPLAERSRGLSEKDLLASLPLAGLEDLGPSPASLQKIAEANGYTLHFAVILTSFPQVSAAVRSGDLAAFLPAFADEDMAQHGLTKMHHPFIDNLAIPISLIWNTQRAEFQPYLATAASRIHAALTRV